jgi:hypothetical protein
MRQLVAPVADWITLSGVLSEDEGRERGMEIDCVLLSRCDEVWLVGGRISPGMQIEADYAKANGIAVCDLTSMGYEAPS